MEGAERTREIWRHLFYPCFLSFSLWWFLLCIRTSSISSSVGRRLARSPACSTPAGVCGEEKGAWMEMDGSNKESVRRIKRADQPPGNKAAAWPITRWRCWWDGSISRSVWRKKKHLHLLSLKTRPCCSVLVRRLHLTLNTNNTTHVPQKTLCELQRYI